MASSSAPVEPLIRSHRRPDGRCVVRPNGAWTVEAATAARELARSRGVPVITAVDAADRAAQQVLADADFAACRHESVVQFGLDRALGVLRGVAAPPGISLRSAVDVDVDRLRALDDELRDDVPGTSGWRNSRAEFQQNTFGDAAFDPATYLVAMENGSREYVGLVRVWMNRDLPRVGMIGVRRPFRRRGIAAALLREALAAARAAGSTRATAEFDVSNDASRALFERLGAERVAATVELAYSP
jgi:ribosomal protein S18 acetylase RimI-like enzyme